MPLVFFSGRASLTSQDVVDFVREELNVSSLIFSVCHVVVIHERKLPTR
jgi:hypothetical protein